MQRPTTLPLAHKRKRLAADGHDEIYGKSKRVTWKRGVLRITSEVTPEHVLALMKYGESKQLHYLFVKCRSNGCSFFLMRNENREKRMTLHSGE
jgi:hypothetical protein